MLNHLLTSGKEIGENVLKSLDVFWKGMLAIAIVIALVIAVTVLMNAISRFIQKKKKERDAAKAAEDSPSDGDESV